VWLWATHIIRFKAQRSDKRCYEPHSKPASSVPSFVPSIFPAGYTTVTAIVELAAGTCSGRHTHPCIDSGFVIQGDFVLKVDGKPEQTFKAGDSFKSRPLVPHDGCSVSGNKLIDTWVIERGKPLASPAP